MQALAQTGRATVGMAIPGATRRIVEEITALLPAPLVQEEEQSPLEARSA